METNSEVTCEEAPSDFISKVQFLNVDKATINGDLLVASWDSTVSLYDSTTGELLTRCKNLGTSPLLACCSCNPIGTDSDHNNDSSKFFAGGLLGDVLVGDFSQLNIPAPVLGRHDKAVSCLDYLPNKGLAFSGSWDKTVKAWDVRTSRETHTITLEGKVFSLAVSYKAEKLVLCDSEKTVTIYDIRDLSKPESIRSQSQPVLKYQFREVACFPDATGYAVASVEGRVAWEYFDPALGPTGSKKNYAFKCHREKEENTELIYPVNALAFNYAYNTFATGGGDSTVSIWDGLNKKRLWKSSVFQESKSVSSLSFNRDGLLLAIALSDGKKDPPMPRVPGQVIVRTLKPEDVSPKSVKKKDD